MTLSWCNASSCFVSPTSVSAALLSSACGTVIPEVCAANSSLKPLKSTTVGTVRAGPSRHAAALCHVVTCHHNCRCFEGAASVGTNGTGNRTANFVASADFCRSLGFAKSTNRCRNQDGSWLRPQCSSQAGDVRCIGGDHVLPGIGRIQTNHSFSSFARPLQHVLVAKDIAQQSHPSLLTAQDSLAG